ncbi:unnamed protein product [Aphanomyces euteiches]
MSPVRLRTLEMKLMQEAPDVELLDEIERQWQIWAAPFDESSRFVGNTSDSMFIRNSSLVSPRPFRCLYWERKFRTMLGQPLASRLTMPINLFHGVVFEVKLRGKELSDENVDCIISIPSIHRVEVHHIDATDQTFWPRLGQLIVQAPNLMELCLLHSKLLTLSPLVDALGHRSERPLDMLEFVSIKMRSSVFVELVHLVSSSKLIRSLRMTNSINDLDASLLVPAIASLDTVLLPFNDLEDDVLATISTSMTTQRLCVSNNCFTNVSALARCANLVQLDLSHNELGNAGIATVASVCLPAMSRLTNLYVYNCAFSAVGAAALFAKAVSSSTLLVLNAGRNFLGVEADDVLVPFLNHNASVTHLHLNYIGLGHDISDSLAAAFSQNSHLKQISLGENRLKDTGAAKLFAALPFPLEALDFSGNLISNDGLKSIVAHISELRQQPKRQRSAHIIQELNLRDNVFDVEHLHRHAMALATSVSNIYSNEYRPKTYDDNLC